jgi:hypothetical protein
VTWNLVYGRIIKRKKFNWMGHILRRNCLINHVIEGRIEGRVEVRGRQERRRRELLDELKETKGYFKFKDETLDRTLWRTRSGIGY